MPSQSWHATHHQWAKGKHAGFVTSTQVVVPAGGDVDAAVCEGPGAAVGMGYWTEDDLPFYYGLARTFPLADRWFSSCLGPTFPNRRFLIAGTAHGLIDDAPVGPARLPARRDDLRPAGPARHFLGELPSDRLGRVTRSGATCGTSAGWPVAGCWPPGRSFPAVPPGVQKDLQFTADVFPVGIGRYMRHVHGTDQFFADADNGTLPAFSIVDPDFQAYSEENPQDISKGESFAAEVINRGHARPGLARHAADLGLRRARRLLRPRAAAPGGTAR